MDVVPPDHEAFYSKYSAEPPSWYEFLLDDSGSKLQAHLDGGLYPPPAHLVSQFVDKACSAVSNTDGVVRMYSRKLWEIALETASFYGWRASLLSEIPVPIRQKLLSHLVKVTVPTEIRAQDITQLEFSAIPGPGLAALFLYHHWISSSFVQLHFYQKQTRKDWPGAVAANVALQQVEPELTHSIEFLQKMANSPIALTLPQLHSANKLPLRTSSLLSAETVAAQTHFDLGEIFFYYSSYAIALSHFQEALKSITKADTDFLSFTKAKVSSYVRGLEFLFTSDKDQLDSITAQLEACRTKNFEGCVGVLLLDNKRRELALSERRVLLREVREKSPDTKLHTMAYLCNVLLEVILGRTTPQLFWDILKGDRDLVLDFLIFAIQDYLEETRCARARSHLKLFLLAIMSRRHTRNRAQDLVKAFRESLGLPGPSYQSLMPGGQPLARLSHPTSREAELAECYEKLTATHSFTATREIISKICQLQPNFRAQSYCDRIYRNTQKTSMFVALCESFACPWPLALVTAHKLAHMYQHNHSDRALLLLVEIRNYLRTAQFAAFKRNNNSRHLEKMEVIFNSMLYNRNVLVSRHRVKVPDDYLDSIRIFHASHHSNGGGTNLSFETGIISALLTNTGLAPIVTDIPDGYNLISAQIAAFIKNPSATDLSALQRFLLSIHDKQPNSTLSTSMLLDFACQLKEETALEVLCAALAKLLMDSEKQEYQTFPSDLISRSWAKVSNIKNIDTDMCISTLTRLLDHCLTVAPHNLKLIALQAAVKMSLGDNEATIKLLLCSGALISDGFSDISVLDRWLETSFYNLVKACMNIGAHVEVSLLCCLKSPPEYGTSFQALKRIVQYDHLHLYYPLFWDVNLLECAIAQHHKKGDILLRDFVIGLMRRPEMNENNHPDLVTRSQNSKKCAFLRTMFQKFLCS